jgi:hypothetical protein
VPADAPDKSVCVANWFPRFAGGYQKLRETIEAICEINGLIAEEVSDLRESWMTHADQVLADEQ